MEEEGGGVGDRGEEECGVDLVELDLKMRAEFLSDDILPWHGPAPR